MKLNIRVDKKLNNATLRNKLDTRARFVLTRLSPQLRSVSVTVNAETVREGGRTVCQVSGALERGGRIHVSGSETSPGGAIDLALERFRRTTFRALARRPPSPDRSLAPPPDHARDVAVETL